VNRLRMLGLGVLLGVLSALLLPAAPASAHGALTLPISRAAACGVEGGADARTAACKAAIAASPAGAAAAWDDIRVPNVNGRDRSVIPNGKLCSGGLAQFAGLNLARADWPTTSVRPGAAFTFQYKTTIPHTGTFRLYVTNQSYDPTKPLNWSDLGTTPFLTVKNPPVTNGAYLLRGRTPTGRTGHQVIYAIWQTSSTPDTYYSCSDVLFPAAAAPAQAGGTAAPVPSPPTPVPPAADGSGTQPIAASAAASQSAPPDRVDPSVAAVQITEPQQRPWPLIVGVGVALAIIGGLGLLALRFKPRPRHRA
jgi:predicted carbohydrate-binding protein with CBM5 and CBM33 domain